MSDFGDRLSQLAAKGNELLRPHGMKISATERKYFPYMRAVLLGVVSLENEARKGDLFCLAPGDGWYMGSSYEDAGHVHNERLDFFPLEGTGTINVGRPGSEHLVDFLGNTEMRASCRFHMDGLVSYKLTNTGEGDLIVFAQNPVRPTAHTAQTY